MERDQHSTPGPGGGEIAGDRGREPDARLPEEARGAEAPAAEEEARHPAPGPSAPAEASAPEGRPDVIMSKLPRTRPQRVTGRRQRAASAESPSAQRAASGRPKASRAAASTRAGKQRKRAAASARATPDTARPTRRRAAAAAPAARTPSPRRAPEERLGKSEAPGLPRLALDGAVEAAKLPLKVGGRLTLRALDAVARGLRGG